MKIPMAGGSKKAWSKPFDGQDTINLFPVIDKEGREVVALYGTPGLNQFSVCGVGPVRGEFCSSNGRSFVVSNNKLYEVLANGTSSSFALTLDTAVGAVTMDENPFQLAICDGAAVYIFTYATNAFVKVSDPDLPISGTLTYIDGYFIVNKVGTGSFYISAINDGLSWAALDFATAESSPDELLRVLNASSGQLWLLGTKTTEVWYNSGAALFPFAKIAGGKLETGILAPYTAVAMDNSIYWVGRDDRGSGIVYKAEGFTPQRISDDSIELLIQSAPTPSTLRSYTYQENGHTFYIITGGGMESTLAYDLATQLWHKKAALNVSGEFELHAGSCAMFAFGKQLIGDRRNGNIYEQSMNFYTDNGDEIARERTYTHISEENQLIKYTNLEVGFETGVGTQTGQGVNPKATLYISRDGARTWTGGVEKEIGRAGKYKTRVRWTRLGQARVNTYRLRVTDPVKVAMFGSYLNAGSQ